MSNPPPPPPYQPYQMPYQTPPPSFYQPPLRPTSVTVLAVLGIVFGGLGSACGWINILPYFGGPMQNEVTQAFSSDPVMRAWVIFSAIYGWLVSILMLVAGIQCMRLRPIGRTLMLAYAWLSVVMVVPGQIMNFVYMMPALQNLQATSPSPAIKAAVTTGYISAIGGAVIGLAIVAWVFYVFTRPHVKAAFATGGQTAAV